MGLGAQKRRSKLSHDPNNTAWSRDTDTYGHKILSRQGWQPGSYLGATNASHAEHYTAANASHVRVFLREENLGLGAQVGKSGAETFGLSLFSGVLGRLNGKSEGEVQKHQDALRDVELRTYQERKFGMVGFVRGGFLVGDRIEDRPDGLSSGAEVVERARKKRKVQDDEDVVAQPIQSTKTKRKAISEGDGEHQSTPVQATDETTLVVSKEKKRKNKRSKNSPIGSNDEDQSSIAKDDERASRKQERREKRARKEERRKQKAEKGKQKLKKISGPASNASDDDGHDETPAEEPESQPPPPSSIPAVMGGRQAVRQRYIQQKRLASMNPQAMKEIFMLSAAG